ncbi:TPA: LysR family transcriptional regulator [Pseudomonas aeruginosa]|uniref:winged helix-turn-helix domain-containing protein n=1 Tax=Pseudomonas aeruginosa TaxID=287 RepID=UPI000F53E1B1|nr:LysR family transcriptional regulator [Pseudomonas aeruginosa]RPS20483.1 LysR family transcriptional regulator [Pseudomonas aeruginosa]RPS68431.1 LysR family transcriptional regulator [Pseudomonas aeruginosa]HCR1517621.1 LysR family transcriptional regulator [Pseudomonas aeruginosa]
MTSTVSLRVRLHLGEDIAIGPGKVDLLEAIQRSGSISGAARELGMSYRRAWLLVETMNRCFREPLVISLVGGRHGGGARLSDAGEQVLRQFRSIEARARSEVETGMATIQALLKC